MGHGSGSVLRSVHGEAHGGMGPDSTTVSIFAVGRWASGASRARVELSGRSESAKGRGHGLSALFFVPGYERRECERLSGVSEKTSEGVRDTV